MKDKSKVLKMYGYMFEELQFKSLYEMFQNALNRHWLTYILPMVFFAFMFHFYISTY